MLFVLLLVVVVVVIVVVVVVVAYYYYHYIIITTRCVVDLRALLLQSLLLPLYRLDLLILLVAHRVLHARVVLSCSLLCVVYSCVVALFARIHDCLSCITCLCVGVVVCVSLL